MTIPCGLVAAIITKETTVLKEDEEPPSCSKLWLCLTKIWSTLASSWED